MQALRLSGVVQDPVEKTVLVQLDRMQATFARLSDECDVVPETDREGLGASLAPRAARCCRAMLPREVKKIDKQKR